jgi:hypothetical protein
VSLVALDSLHGAWAIVPLVAFVCGGLSAIFNMHNMYRHSAGAMSGSRLKAILVSPSALDLVRGSLMGTSCSRREKRAASSHDSLHLDLARVQGTVVESRADGVWRRVTHKILLTFEAQGRRSDWGDWLDRVKELSGGDPTTTRTTSRRCTSEATNLAGTLSSVLPPGVQEDGMHVFGPELPISTCKFWTIAARPLEFRSCG